MPKPLRHAHPHLAHVRLRFDAAWEFFSWQNITVALGFLLWTVLIARFKRRTPLEAIMPSLDRQLVELIARPECGYASGATD